MTPNSPKIAQALPAGTTCVCQQEYSEVVRSLHSALFPAVEAREPEQSVQLTLEQPARRGRRLRQLILAGVLGCLTGTALAARAVLIESRREQIVTEFGELKKTVTGIFSSSRGGAPPIAVLRDEPSTPLTAPKEAAARPTAVPPSSPRFAVQVGAFENRTSALTLASQLSDRYELAILVAPVELRNRTLHRVRILVETRTEAEALAASLLRDQKLETRIVALR